MELQLKPLDRVKWCCCMGNRTAAMIVAGVELAWLMALAILVVWRWSIADRDDDDEQMAFAAAHGDEGGGGMNSRGKPMTPAETEEYVARVKTWFRAITAVMFAAFVAGLLSNICLIIGLKQLRVKLITTWLIVTACLMVLVILFLLLPLVFGGRPTYSAFIEFLVDAWFFLIVLGAREDTKLAVYESAQMRYDPSSNGVPQTPAPVDFSNRNSISAQNGSYPPQFSADNTISHDSIQQPYYDEIAGIDSNHQHRDNTRNGEQFYSNVNDDVESQRNSNHAHPDAVNGNHNSSQFDMIDGGAGAGDLGRQQQFPYSNRNSGQQPSVAAAAAPTSFPIGAAPLPAGSTKTPIDVVRRLKARFTRRG